MTVPEMQTLRDALYQGYLAWVQAGCPQSYSINGRSMTRVNADTWLAQINQLDAGIARAKGGNVFAAQFRQPE